MRLRRAVYREVGVLTFQRRSYEKSKKKKFEGEKQLEKGEGYI